MPSGAVSAFIGPLIRSSCTALLSRARQLRSPVSSLRSQLSGPSLLLSPINLPEHLLLEDLPSLGFVLGTGDADLDDAGGTAAAGERPGEACHAVFPLADVPGAEALDPGGFEDMDLETAWIDEGGGVELPR